MRALTCARGRVGGRATHRRTAGYARRWRRLYGELLGRLPVATPATEPGRPASLAVSKLTRGTLAPIQPDDLAGMPVLGGKNKVGGGKERTRGERVGPGARNPDKAAGGQGRRVDKAAGQGRSADKAGSGPRR